MLKFMYYSSKNNSCVTGKGPTYAVPSNSDFIWIFMSRPDEKEIERVSRDFKIGQNHFRAFMKETRSVRYSINPLVFVFMDYFLENGLVKNSHILFILKENCLIVALPSVSQFHENLFDVLVERFKSEKKKNIAHLMHTYMLEDVDENYEVLEKVEHMIIGLETDIMKGRDGERIQDIIKLKRSIYRMSRRFWGSAKIVFMVKKGITPVKMDKESIMLMDDIYNTYMHQIDILSSAKEMLTDVMSIHSTTVSNDLNLIIKKLTSLTVIIMVPTLIASIYGMNFAYIPELRHELGYPGALFAMLFSIILSYAFFHRKKWI